jgi:hypothetical protein
MMMSLNWQFRLHVSKYAPLNFDRIVFTSIYLQPSQLNRIFNFAQKRLFAIVTMVRGSVGVCYAPEGRGFDSR